MKFKVGDIVRPKKPMGIDEWYDVKYRIIQIDGKFAIMEVLIDDKAKKEILEEIEHNLNIDTEIYPPWVDIEINVKIGDKHTEFGFDEDEWELVEDD